MFEHDHIQRFQFRIVSNNFGLYYTKYKSPSRCSIAYKLTTSCKLYTYLRPVKSPTTIINLQRRKTSSIRSSSQSRRSNKGNWLIQQAATSRKKTARRVGPARPLTPVILLHLSSPKVERMKKVGPSSGERSSSSRRSSSSSS